MPSINSLKTQLRWLSLQEKLWRLLPGDSIWKQRFTIKNKLKGTQLKSLLQEKLIHNLFGSKVSGIVFNTYNGLMVSSIKDVQVNCELGKGSFNKNEVEVLKSFIPAESCLYVIGTHIGTLLIPIGKDVRKVVGFEANPVTFELLLNNVNINGLKNSQVFNYAISDKQASLTFYRNTANSGGSKIKPLHDDFIYNYDNPESIKVDGDSLDALITRFNLEAPECIIMDIEGAEYFALQGAQKCLTTVKLLYIEFVPHHLDKVAGVKINDFINVIKPHFNSMKIMQEVIDGNEKLYTGEEIGSVMNSLYEQHKSADLLFFK